MVALLNGKNVLITGASRGVGRAAAALFLQEGARVIGVGRDGDRLRHAAAELSRQAPDRFLPLCLDLGSPEAASHLAAEVGARFEHLDVAIFNAGIQLHHEGGIMSEPEEMILESMKINLYSPLWCARALLPILERSSEPRIVNVGSGAGGLALMTDGGIASYRLSKWSLHGLTMLQANELRGRVSVNAFDPGWIKTDLGGPKAPGTPEQAALGMLSAITLPWDISGQFHKDGQEVPW